MARKLHAHAVSRVLASAGHVRSKWVAHGQQWTPGFRVVEATQSSVIVCFEGQPADVARLEASSLAGYASTLRDRGYVTTLADRPMIDGVTGRRKIYVTRRDGDA